MQNARTYSDYTHTQILSLQVRQFIYKVVPTMNRMRSSQLGNFSQWLKCMAKETCVWPYRHTAEG